MAFLSFSLAGHERYMNAFEYSKHGLEGFPEVPFLALVLGFFYVRNVAGSVQCSESEHCKAYYIDCPGINLS